MLKQFIDDRTQISYEQYRDNAEYIKMANKRNELFKQISAMLPEEARKLMQQYDNLDAEIQAYTEEYLFLQGMKDGAQMRDFLLTQNVSYKSMLLNG